MGDIYEFDNKESQAILIENEIKKQEAFMKDTIWYHGVTGRADAENRILNNGEFLVRVSQDNDSKFVVTTKWNGKFLHLVIKTDVNKNHQLVYFIDENYKFQTVFDVIKYHKDQQCPLSVTSSAVLYKPVDINNGRNRELMLTQRESKFRKSSNIFRKHGDKKPALPRCGSETYLMTQRYSSSDMPELNKSLTNLSHRNFTDDGPHKPSKPSFKMLNSKLLLHKLRPDNIRVRNKKLYKDASKDAAGTADSGSAYGDYSDYSQVKDVEGGLRREKARRGLSVDNSSGLKNFCKSVGTFNGGASSRRKKKQSLDESVYVLANGARSVASSTMTRISRFTKNRSVDEATYVAAGASDDRDVHKSQESIYMTPFVSSSSPPVDGQSDLTLTSTTPVDTPVTDTFDIYGLDRIDRTEWTGTSRSLWSQLTAPGGMASFVNLSLATHEMASCGPVESTFDKIAINKVATFLLANNNGHLVLCRHLLDEWVRVFQMASGAPISGGWPVGYRSILMSPASEMFQRDLQIRQTALANFIMATIVSTSSNEKRVNLICFWIKCADCLLTYIQDMFHFTAICSAIFSDQILALRAWKTVYRNEPSIKSRMESLKEAIKNGCILRTDIDQCVPDLVQLCNVVLGNEEDLDVFSRVCFDTAMWSDQAFTSPNIWLRKIIKELDTISVIPFYRELVQTETLLCLVLGKNSIKYKDVSPLFEKVSDCIRMMVILANDGQI